MFGTIIMNCSRYTDMEIKDCYYLGKVTKPWGVKGQVILFLDVDEPEIDDEDELNFGTPDDEDIIETATGDEEVLVSADDSNSEE